MKRMSNMETNQVFDLQRFESEIRRVVLSRRRTVLLQALIVVSLIILGMLYIQYLALNRIAYQKEYIDIMMRTSVLTSEMVYILSVTVILGCIAGSLLFMGIGSKGVRCEILTTPTSMFEKYLAQWLLYIPGFFVVVILSVVAGDCVRVVLFSIKAPEGVSIYSLLTLMRDDSDDFIRMIQIAACYYFVFSSLFVLGALVWSRNCFLKTFSVIVATGIALFVWTVAWHETFNSDLHKFYDIIPGSKAWWAVAISLLFALFNWWLAYRRFKETDIMPHISAKTK